MLNSIGLENSGGRGSFKKNIYPLWQEYNTPLIVNIAGQTIREYVQLAEKLSTSPIVKALEVNISCPNVQAGGMVFGSDPEMVFQVIKQVKENTDLPIIAKLTPNVTDIVTTALAAEAAGADALSLINTLLGMSIDLDKKRPVLANQVGGLSGPAIKPIGVRMVWQVALK